MRCEHCGSTDPLNDGEHLKHDNYVMCLNAAGSRGEES